MMTVPVVLAFLFILAAPAVAQQMYEWVDDQGRKHFTDNINRVPEKYRDQVTGLGSVTATPEQLTRDAARRRQQELERTKEAAEASQKERQNEERVRRAQQAIAAEQAARDRQQRAAVLEAHFNQTAQGCAASAGVRLILKGGGKADIFGTNQARWKFQECMAASGMALD